MRTHNSAIRLIAVMCTLSALTASPIFTVLSTPGAAGNASAMTIASAPFAITDAQTDLDVFSLGGDRKVQGRITDREWPGTLVGFNIVRTFRTSTGELRLFAINGNTGRTQTFQITANGTLGFTTASSKPQKLLRCTGAQFVKVGEAMKLITQDSFTGRIRKFTVSDNGELDVANATSSVVADMKDKNLFSIYSNNVSPFVTLTSLIGVDTWTGETVTYSLNLQKITGGLWTRGWTSIDHISIDNITYRLLYKASGDPFRKPGESGDEARRFMIETVNAQGERQTIDNRTLANDGGDFSSVRFVRFPSVRGITGYGVLFYKRTTGEYSIFEFDPQTGLRNEIDNGTLVDGAPGSAEASPAPPYIDVEPYLLASGAFLAFVSPDNAIPLGFEQAERVGQIMHDSLKANTVGYQFMLAQSGRIFFSRGSGKVRLDHNDALETPMTTRTQLNVGSVSKVITAMTMMKLVEKGDLSLKDNIALRLTANQYNSDSWVKHTPVLNLLAHTTGMTKDNPANCSTNDNNLTVNCTDFFNAKTDDDKCKDDALGNWNCRRSYNNNNTLAARKVIERITGVVDSMGIVNQTRLLWASSADLEGMTCKINPDAYYYGACNGANDCFEYEGKSWRRSYAAADAAWSSTCSSGGWYASSRELLEFLGAIRYRKALGESATTQLLETGLKDIDGGKTAVGWDPAWSADDEENLNKGGYLPYGGVAARAYITRLPNNSDAVLQLNSETGVSGTQLVKDAYKVAVLATPVAAKSGEYNAPIGYDGITRTRISTATSTTEESRHVVVARSAGGNLRLRAFRAPRLAGVPDLDLIADKIASGYTPPAVSSDSVGISDGPNFATVSIGIGSLLNVIGWNLTGSQLTQHASAVGPFAREVAVARVAASGNTTRVVTAIQTYDHKVQLDVWDITNLPGVPQYSTVTRRGSFEGLFGYSIDIKSLGKLSDFSKPARIVVANVSSGYELGVKTLEVSTAGNISAIDTKYFSEFPVSSWQQPDVVSLDTVGDGVSKFFSGKGFMTSHIAGSRLLTVVTWSVSPEGMISLVARMQTGGDVQTQAMSATTSIVTLTDDADKFVKVIKWQISDDGMTITRPWNVQPGFQASAVAAGGNVVGAFVQFSPANHLKLVNWVVLNP